MEVRDRKILSRIGAIIVTALVCGTLVYLGLREWHKDAEEAGREDLAHQRMLANRSAIGVEQVLKTQAEAWNRDDLDGFMAGYWDSPDLEFVSGTTTTKGFGPTKERYFQRYKAEGKEMGNLTFSDIAVSVNGDREATATGKWKVVMAKTSPGGGFTLTLRQFENEWKIVKDVTTSDDPPKKE